MTYYSSLNKEELTQEFITTCTTGNLYNIQYLLTNPDLEQHADIHGQDDLGFRNACLFGHLNIVRYLLTSPELTQNGIPFANIHASNDLGLLWASTGHLDVVQYLLTSPEITQVGGTHANLNADGDSIFQAAYTSNQTEIVHYFIFDTNIPFSQEIRECLEQDKYDPLKVEKMHNALKMFQIRDNYNTLNQNLSVKSLNKPKNKI